MPRNIPANEWSSWVDNPVPVSQEAIEALSDVLTRSSFERQFAADRSRAHRVSPPSPSVTLEEATDCLREFGYEFWQVNYSLPEPYPRRETVFAVECTSDDCGRTIRQVFTFKRDNRGRLDIYEAFSESDYINAIRRTGKSLEPYYRAVQSERRKLVARVLAAGGDVQFLLPPIVDDDEFRNKLTTPAYKKQRFAAEAKKKVDNKMRNVRSIRRMEALSANCNEPCTETPRGQRAMTAAERGRDRQRRRQERRDRPTARPVAQAVPARPVGSFVGARPVDPRPSSRVVDARNGWDDAFGGN